MLIETFARRLAKAAAPFETQVRKSSRYWDVEVFIHFPGGNMIAGAVAYSDNKIDDDAIDLDAVAAQCREAEGADEGTLFVMAGGARCVGGNCYPKTNFRNLIIPEGVTTARGFEDFKKLENVTLPSTLKVIAADCFNSCESLQSIKLPDAVESIDARAFISCKKLSEISIPQTIKEICQAAFKYCNALADNGFDSDLYQMTNGVLIDKKRQTAITILNIPEIEVPQGVRAIGQRAAYNCENIQRVVLPESVGSIEDNAFYRCTALSDIKLPQRVWKIGESAFEDCHSLTDIVLHDRVKIVPAGAFRDCHSLKSVTITNATSIEENAFLNCKSLTSVSLPDSLTSIGDSAFSDCVSLTAITLPAGLKILGNGKSFWDAGVFDGCSSLATINIPDGIKDISGVFVKCPLLTSLPLRIGEGNTEIPDNAFHGCGFKTLDLSRFTSIGSCAFRDCPNLETIEIPATITRIGAEAFANCQSLRSVIIVNPDTTIEIDAFSYCDQLTSVTLPKGLTRSKLKTRFRNTPWGETGSGKAAEKKAKEAKLAEMRDVAVVALTQGSFAPYQAKVTLEGDIIAIEAEGPNDCSLIANIFFAKSNAPEALDRDRLAGMKRLMEQCQEPGTMFVTGDKDVVKMPSFINVDNVRRIVYMNDFDNVFDSFSGFKSLSYVKLPESVKLWRSTFSDFSPQLVIDSLRYAIVDGWFIDKKDKEVLDDLIGFENRFLK